ncbi:MAG: hypothetical protein ACHQHN_14835 [Sphingobacteriales bacterium]
MKKTLTILCLFLCLHSNTWAQNILSLQTITITDATVILPNLTNLRELLKASNEDFLATMTSLHYKQSKADDAYTFQASGLSQVYNVDKEDKMIDIYFSDNGGYAKSVKDAFLEKYPNARHKSMDDGIEAYYFDMNDGSGTLHYCILFDSPADGGGGVTLLAL